VVFEHLRRPLERLVSYQCAGFSEIPFTVIPAIWAEVDHYAFKTFDEMSCEPAAKRWLIKGVSCARGIIGVDLAP
jgi:hypothetical protein